MTFAPDDIELKEFVPTLRGYDRAEVRAYLRAVAEDYRRLHTHAAELREELATRPVLREEIAAAPPAGVDVSAMLALEQSIRDLTSSIHTISSRSALHPATLDPEVADAATSPPETSEKVSASVARPGPGTESESAPESSSAEHRSVPHLVEAATDGNEGVFMERRGQRRPWSSSEPERRAQYRPLHAKPSTLFAVPNQHATTDMNGRHFRTSVGESDSTGEALAM
jgi:DivIVA domain-containing protein